MADTLDDPRFAPFTRHDTFGELGLSVSPGQRVLLVLGGVLAIVKLAGAALALISFWICCHVCNLLLREPHRTPVIAALGRLHCRICLLCLGFLNLRWVHVPPSGVSYTTTTATNGSADSNGAGAPPAGAIVSNHCCWTDILIMMSHFFPSFVARDKTASTPFVGVISKMMGCIYVDREHLDPSKPGVATLVKERIASIAARELPSARPVLLFPEGTTTNGRYLLPFKTGAFLAGVPVRPVVLRYGVGRFSPTWEMIAAPRQILYMLCVPLHTVTCWELPVYVPSAAERADPKLYAANVRKAMMEFAPWLHDTDATFADKLQLKALLRKKYGLPEPLAGKPKAA